MVDNKFKQKLTKCLFSLPSSRETLKTKDNGQVSLDWVFNDENNKLYPDAETRPTVVVLPGITGNCFY